MRWCAAIADAQANADQAPPAHPDAYANLHAYRDEHIGGNDGGE
jgi:hypothetical protein